MRTVQISIGAMTCVNCQNKIEKKLASLSGIQKAIVSYKDSSAVITYNEEIISLDDICDIIRSLGYEIFENKPALNVKRGVGVLIMIFAAFMLMRQFGFSNIFNSFPLAEVDMQYSMLIIIGLLTSIHCIAMCGGINLSQCIPQTKRDSSNSRWAVLVPSFLYNLGRVISYTIVGAIVGGLGGVISFDGSMKGIVQLAAGLFMIVMGINMLGIFAFF